MNPTARRIRAGLAVTGRRKDGAEIPVEVSLSPVETEEGLQAVAFITDVSARVIAERAARQADRLAALGSMGASIAHEINNPVGIMVSRIELMLADAASQGLPQAVVDDLEVLRRNAERVARIAHGLLSFSRESPAAREAVDLNRVVTETLLLAEPQIGKQGVRIVTQLRPGLPAILGHAAALEQVLLNLLTNASDAMDGRGEIRIESGLAPWPPGSVRLRVTDTGPGIPPDALPRIFDPFYTTKPSGTGLGLSISYGIVREHRGTIDVESQPGRGTAFTLTFPRFEAEIA
jgi:signal transduction histidine kinase